MASHLEREAIELARIFNAVPRSDEQLGRAGQVSFADAVVVGLISGLMGFVWRYVGV